MTEELERLHESSQELRSACMQTIGRSEMIRKIVDDNMRGYLLRRNPEEQAAYKEKYERHVDLIADFLCRIDMSGIDLDIIRGLHRHLYHGIDRIPLKKLGGVMEDSYMYPGEYKQKETYIRSVLDITRFITFSSPSKVPQEMETLLLDINDRSADIFERYFRFIAEFVGVIHPFPDSNGKTAYIIGDIFLLDNGIQPFFIGEYISGNSGRVYKLLEKYKSDEDRDLNGFYDLGNRMYKAQK